MVGWGGGDLLQAQKQSVDMLTFLILIEKENKRPVVEGRGGGVLTPGSFKILGQNSIVGAWRLR